MKKHVKKVFKRTLIGSAMIMGFLVSGLDSASASTMENFKDYNGNQIEFNTEYYLEPIKQINQSQGIVAENWSAKLGNKSDAMTVKLIPTNLPPHIFPREHYPYIDFNAPSNVPIELALETNVKKPIEIFRILSDGEPFTFLDYQTTYLNAKSNGVELATQHDTNWRITINPMRDGNHFNVQLQDSATGKWLSNGNPGESLSVDIRTPGSGNALWKLIKK
ncbi:hypothetical protein [Bacillus wiedmannii]|uniref:hypothetical protein n=1 Tax=Bacillus wiedmannii TaxID=1890302 RepID=UPI000B42E5F0|nr:hypothetical protein BK740_21410 [Bacillus thuringiensis serovar argentinensis]